jgi:hypothetical protein
VYGQQLQNKLFPDHTYSVVSGGEPLDIPDLTWEELRRFHATHYHPSNARYTPTLATPGRPALSS